MEIDSARRPQRIALQPPEMKYLVKTTQISPSRKFAIISRHIWSPTQHAYYQPAPTAFCARPIIDMIGNPPERLVPPGAQQRRTSDAEEHVTKQPSKPQLSQLIIGYKQAYRVQASQFTPSSPKKQPALPREPERIPLLPAFNYLLALLPASFSDKLRSDADFERQRSAVLSTVCNCRFADEFAAQTCAGTPACMQSTMDLHATGYFDAATSKCAKTNLAGKIQICRDLALAAGAEATRLYGVVATRQAAPAELRKVVEFIIGAFTEDSAVTNFFASERSAGGDFFDAKVADYRVRTVSRLLRSGFMGMLERQLIQCNSGVESARFGYFTLIFALCCAVAPCIRDGADDFVASEFCPKVTAALASKAPLSLQCALGCALLCRCNYNFAFQIVQAALGRAQTQLARVLDVIDRAEVQRVRETYDDLEMSDYSDEIYDEPETRGRLLNVIRASKAISGTAGIRQSRRVEQHLLKRDTLEQKREIAVEELRNATYIANVCIACVCYFLPQHNYQALAKDYMQLLRDVSASGIVFMQPKLRGFEEQVLHMVQSVDKWRFYYVLGSSIMENQAADLVPGYYRLLREQ